MSQLVFIHGPGAGACAEGFTYQMDRFHGSFAPNLPGHLSGEPCPDVGRYAEWLRGWLWANGAKKDRICTKTSIKGCLRQRCLTCIKCSAANLIYRKVKRMTETTSDSLYHTHRRLGYFRSNSVTW